MLKEEKELRERLFPKGRGVVSPKTARLINALIRAVRAEEREIWITAARNSHRHHSCNMNFPCELCRLMNPNCKPAAKIRGGK